MLTRSTLHIEGKVNAVIRPSTDIGGNQYPRSSSNRIQTTSEALDNRHVRLTTSFAHGLQAIALAAILERVEQSGH
jgi:hypothetical protein